MIERNLTFSLLVRISLTKFFLSKNKQKIKQINRKRYFEKTLD